MPCGRAGPPKSGVDWGPRQWVFGEGDCIMGDNGHSSKDGREPEPSGAGPAPGNVIICPKAGHLIVTAPPATLLHDKTEPDGTHAVTTSTKGWLSDVLRSPDNDLIVKVEGGDPGKAGEPETIERLVQKFREMGTRASSRGVWTTTAKTVS